MVNSVDGSTHAVGEWRSAPSYWDTNSYRDPETGEGSFNSCTNSKLSVVEVCGGHGQCAPFNRNDVEHPVFYCRCDPEWAGLECSFRRKKQTVAWFLSLLFGPFAADQIYLGWTAEALFKLILVIVGAAIGSAQSGVGVSIVMFVWMFDVVRIGMGPVLAKRYRVQEDMPRLTFAILTVLFFAILGMLGGLSSMYYRVIRRRRQWDEMSCYGATKNVL